MVKICPELWRHEFVICVSRKKFNHIFKWIQMRWSWTWTLLILLPINQAKLTPFKQRLLTDGLHTLNYRDRPSLIPSTTLCSLVTARLGLVLKTKSWIKCIFPSRLTLANRSKKIWKIIRWFYLVISSYIFCYFLLIQTITLHANWISNAGTSPSAVSWLHLAMFPSQLQIRPVILA